MVMIDWLGLLVFYPHVGTISAGAVMSYDAEGVQEWNTPKRVMVEGSHSTAISVRSSPMFPETMIEISGNPVKFMQGHNIFGTSDIKALAHAFIEQALTHVGLPVTDAHRALWDAAYVQRVDITASYDLGNQERVLSAIRSLEHTATLANRGRGSLVGASTLTYGKGSSRWWLKFYSKGAELQAKGHRLPNSLYSHIERLQTYASGLLRCEIQFKRRELEPRSLHQLCNWQDDTPRLLFAEYMGRLNIAAVTMIDDDKLQAMPMRLRGAYELWRSGVDLRDKKAIRTFYRLRKELLEHGVDIVAAPPVREKSNVIPMPIVLHARMVTEIPDWARGTPLYYEPPRRIA